MPPFRVKNGPELNERLGNAAIIGEVVQIPVFNYVEPSVRDDINVPGCDYVSAADGYYWTHPATFEKYESTYLPVLKEPFRVAFNMS